MVTVPSDAAALATAAAHRMWEGDHASKALGMRIDQVGPGTARLSMTVRPDMVNGHGTCHGGMVASLADSAFAIACNTDGTVTVAAGFEVTFVAPVRLGDVLVAEAREVVRHGRSGIYDVTVRRGTTVIAVFRGRSRSLGRPLPEEQ